MGIPRRNNLPNAKNGERFSLSLDARARDGLEWLRHVARVVLGLDVGDGVIVRAALQHYVRHFEHLLEPANAEGRDIEEAVLRSAARGNSESLTAEALNATPPRPFSIIEKEARDARINQGRDRIASLLKGPGFDPLPESPEDAA